MGFHSMLVILVFTFFFIDYIQAAANYRSLVPVKRYQSNRRYKDFRTMNQHRPSAQPNCLRVQAQRYQRQHHVIRPRSTIEKSDGKQFVPRGWEIPDQSCGKQWHSMSEVKRDLQMNPEPPKMEAPPPEQMEPPPKPKPRPKSKNKSQKKQKKVHVEMVKITTIDPNAPQDQPPMMAPPMMGPPPGFMGPPPQMMGPPPGYNGPPPMMGPPPLSSIPRWTENQGPPPPWAYQQQNGRPPWANEPPRRWATRGPPARQKPKDALDALLSEDTPKKGGGSSNEKWPLRGDSERHRWESREGSDIYWELESTKRLASWDPNKNTGPLWKAASRSSSGAKKKWEDNLDDLTANPKDEEVWDDAKHGGVPKPPLQYLKEFRRP